MLATDGWTVWGDWNIVQFAFLMENWTLFSFKTFLCCSPFEIEDQTIILLVIFCLKFARVHVTIFIYIRSCGICAPHISHLILSEMSHIFILLLFNYTKHWTPYETSHSTSPYLCCVLSLAAINIINSGKYFRSICKVSTWEISDKISGDMWTCGAQMAYSSKKYIFILFSMYFGELQTKNYQ